MNVMHFDRIGHPLSSPFLLPVSSPSVFILFGVRVGGAQWILLGLHSGWEVIDKRGGNWLEAAQLKTTFLLNNRYCPYNFKSYSS